MFSQIIAMGRYDEKEHAKLVIQVTCVGALVILSALDAFSTTFAVDKLVYAIIAGILFGVGGVRELLGGAHSQNKDDDNDKK
jgi:hypothetical protein